MTVAVVAAPDAHDYGSVVFDQEGRILSFAEKKMAGTGWVNAGIYAVSRPALDFVHAGPVFAFRHCGYFLDFGTPERFARREREWPEIAKQMKA